MQFRSLCLLPGDLLAVGDTAAVEAVGVAALYPAVWFMED